MDAIQRGINARALLENEMFKEALNTLDEEYTAAWREAKTPDAREDCWRYTKCLEKLVAHLQSVATTGMIKERDRQELEGRKKGLFSL